MRRRGSSGVVSDPISHRTPLKNAATDYEALSVRVVCRDVRRGRLGAAILIDIESVSGRAGLRFEQREEFSHPGGDGVGELDCDGVATTVDRL